MVHVKSQCHRRDVGVTGGFTKILKIGKQSRVKTMRVRF